MRTAVSRLLLAALPLAIPGLQAGAQGGPPLPNIVFIYVDDLGWRDLSVQGSRYYETPNVDRLATQGLRFAAAYSNAPNCAPSRAALLSGQYAPRTGIYTVGPADRGEAANRKLVPVENRVTLDLGVVTVAEVLSAAGYATGHVGKWHLGGPGFLPTNQGFQWAIGGDAAGAPPSHHYPYGRGERSLPGLEEGVAGEYLADRLTDEAIGFLERHRNGPFFLYLSHYGVHTPIQGRADLVAGYASKPGADGHDNPEYAAMIGAVDAGVGRLLEALDRLDLAANTMVIFYSDNGGFGPATSMAPLRAAKGSLYEGGIRVPLVIRWPGRVRAGTVTDVPVIGTDFYPTFLEMAGARPPVGQPMDGRSLLPLLTGGTLPERDLFWHFPAYLEADQSTMGPWRTTPVSVVRRGGYKLMHFFEDDRWELYDLDRDVAESRNLANERPAQVSALRTTLQAWWAETGAFLPRPK